MLVMDAAGTAMLSLGEAGEGSPNASAMLRIATLSAWAQLASSSVERPYLAAVIQPHRRELSNLWIAALRDYASIRAGSEELQDTSSASLDVAYASLGRDILLPVRAEQHSCLRITTYLCFSTTRNLGLLY